MPGTGPRSAPSTTGARAHRGTSRPAASVLDRPAGFESSRIAERSGRGKLQKAREGRVVGGHPVNYGFRMNATGDGYEVDKRRMPVVRRLIALVADGHALTAVARVLDAEGIPGPRGERWNTKAVRAFVLDDVYRPHTHRAIAALVSPEVSGRLDPERSHGVWWYNRERWRRRRVSVLDPSGAGRLYRWRVSSSPRPRSEWVAVPVPDAGIPREIVEAARQALARNVANTSKGDRFWELSGGVLRCAECGGRMRTTATRRKGKTYFYYACAGRRDGRGGGRVGPRRGAASGPRPDPNAPRGGDRARAPRGRGRPGPGGQILGREDRRMREDARRLPGARGRGPDDAGGAGREAWRARGRQGDGRGRARRYAFPTGAPPGTEE